MVTPSSAGQCFNEAIVEWGGPIRIRYFTETISAGSYDDQVTLVKSGADLFISGVLDSIDATRGSTDAILLQQGRILQQDYILYLAGSIQTSGALRIGTGSNSGNEYFLIPNGVITQVIGNTDIFKKCYIRRITGTGSLLGE